MRKVFVVFVAIGLFVGGGCSKSAPKVDPNDSDALNMPGVPYGTYQKATNGLNTIKQIEDERGAAARSQ